MKRFFSEFGFSRQALKQLALFSMVSDHIAFCFLSEKGSYRALYLVMRIFGRLAFPLFCFLLVQGFLSTRNVRKYFFRLFFFACISEIPYDLFAYHRIFSLKGQNVLFTLCIALLTLYGMSRIRFSKICLFILVFCGSVFAVLLRTDYSYLGILLSAVMYFWQDERLYQFVLLCVIMGVQGWLNPWEILSLPFLYLYRPEKDAGQKKSSFVQKYFYYAFYPAHLLCFFLFDVFI